MSHKSSPSHGVKPSCSPSNSRSRSPSRYDAESHIITGSELNQEGVPSEDFKRELDSRHLSFLALDRVLAQVSLLAQETFWLQAVLVLL